MTFDSIYVTVKSRHNESIVMEGTEVTPIRGALAGGGVTRQIRVLETVPVFIWVGVCVCACAYTQKHLALCT